MYWYRKSKNIMKCTDLHLCLFLPFDLESWILTTVTRVRDNYWPLVTVIVYDTSAAFSNASTRESSPTKQYLWRHFLLFSRRTFAGARFAERSTVPKLAFIQNVCDLIHGRYNLFCFRNDITVLGDMSDL